jgi:MFS transporter, DHA2 family, multidrug resistance protein
MDPVAAGRAATSLLGRAVAGQSTVIAFDTAFNAVALLFVFAAPVLVAIKIGLSRYMRKRTEQSSVELTAVPTLIAPTPDMIPRLPSATSASNVLFNGNQRQAENARLPA